MSHKLDLLPSNAAVAERKLSLATQFSDSILPEDIKNLWNLDKVDSKFLSFLAWGLHVDFWRDDIGEARKRALIVDSFSWHRYKGTLWAVRKILLDLGLTATIREWFDIGTAPHTFAIDAYYKGDPSRVLTFLGENTEALLWHAVELTKPERSHLLYLVVIPDVPELEDHPCRHNYCRWSHGFLKGTAEIDLGGSRGSFNISWTAASESVTYLRGSYSIAPRWGHVRFGDPFIGCAYRDASEHFTHLVFSRDDMSAYNTWERRARWNDKTWEKALEEPGIQSFQFFFPKASAVFGYSHYGDFAAMGSRYLHVPDPGRMGHAIYSGNDDVVEYRPIYEYTEFQQHFYAHSRVVNSSVRFTCEVVAAVHATKTRSSCAVTTVNQTTTLKFTAALERAWNDSIWDKGTWEDHDSNGPKYWGTMFYQED